MKTCKLCGNSKPLEDFYRLSKARQDKGDGYDYRCKECVKAHCRSPEYRSLANAARRIKRATPEGKHKNSEQCRKYRESANGKENLKRYRKNYRLPDTGVEKRRIRQSNYRQTKAYKEAVKRYRLKNPEKRAAQTDLMNAIKSGIIFRPSTCSVCNKVCKPHGHHPDYAYPLVVVWLCHSCHVAVHWGAKTP